ncbi:hypothetical protein M0P65_05275 [Candidatus Gracilibacteria bacterium]|nr:hypothetical protein [Candidatus Gracilibacteria bacterium]
MKINLNIDIKDGMLKNLKLFYEVLKELKWDHLSNIYIVGGVPRRLFFNDFKDNEIFDIDIRLDNSELYLKFIEFISMHFATEYKSNNCISFSFGAFKYECFCAPKEQYKKLLQYDWFFKRTPFERNYIMLSPLNVGCFFIRLQDIVTNKNYSIVNACDLESYYENGFENFSLICGDIKNITDYLDYGIINSTYTLAIRELVYIYRYGLSFKSKEDADRHNGYLNLLDKLFFSYENSCFDDKIVVFKALQKRIEKDELPEFKKFLLKNFNNDLVKTICKNIDCISSENSKIKFFRKNRIENVLGDIEKYKVKLSFGIFNLNESFKDKNIFLIENENKEHRFYISYRINDIEDYYEIGYHNGLDWQKIMVPVEFNRKIDIFFSKEDAYLFEATIADNRIEFIEKKIDFILSPEDQFIYNEGLCYFEEVNILTLNKNYNKIKFKIKDINNSSAYFCGELNQRNLMLEIENEKIKLEIDFETLIDDELKDNDITIDFDRGVLEYNNTSKEINLSKNLLYILYGSIIESNNVDIEIFNKNLVFRYDKVFYKKGNF